MQNNKTTKKSLMLVLDKTQEEQNKIAKKLMSMQLFVEGEKQQEQSLKDYLQGYVVKIQEQKHCRIDEVNRYRSFCTQLEQAIEQQAEKIRLAEEQLATLRQSSMEKQYKMTVLQQLIDKKQSLIEQQDEKSLQKTIDELVSRQCSSKGFTPTL